MSLQREILSPVTTAGMLYPALSQQVVQIANFENLASRRQIAKYGQPCVFSAISLDRVQTFSHLRKGDISVTFPKQAGSTAAVVQRVAEGTEIPLDVTPYTQVNVVPYKIAQGFVVTKEMID